MRSLGWKLGGRWSAAALIGLTAVAAHAADDDVKEEPRAKAEAEKDVIIDAPRARVAVPGPGERPFMIRVKLSDYWLGLDCTPLSPTMRAQLKLNEGEGLVVERVVPESPAAKAGIKQHDLLLSAGDKPIKNVEQLMTLLEENKGKELTVHMLRGGEKTTVAVTPEKRPKAEGAPRDRLRWLAGDGEKAIEVLREQLEKSGVPLRMQFFHPGMVLPPGAAVTAFPDDLHVHIHKHGNKPAEVVVERGEKEWTVTEDTLDELPEDVRPHVEGLFGRAPMPKFDVEIDGVPGGTAGATFNIPLPPPGEFGERMERRFEELNHRIEKMREQLDEMREQRRQNREDRRDDEPKKEA